MELPKPTHSKAEVVNMPSRMTVNCRAANPADPTSGMVLYSVGPNQPESLALLADRLTALKQQTPDLKVVIRADKRLPYSAVRAAMRVVAQCDVDMLNVVAHVGDEE